MTMGMVGKTGPDPAKPMLGETTGAGTAGVPLTPRLPISIEPNGIPVRATPPGAVGAVEVGADDETTLPDPEPHIPDIPAVSSVPEVVDTPEVPRIFDESDIPDDIEAPVIAAVGEAVVPIPPPSKLALEPNIDDGEVPTVEHTAPLAVFGMVIVPVTPVGVGLSPGEVISVDPSGIPVGPTGVPGLSPSGEVAVSVGVVGSVPTWAMATLLQARRAGSITASHENLIVVPLQI